MDEIAVVFCLCTLCIKEVSTDWLGTSLLILPSGILWPLTPKSAFFLRLPDTTLCRPFPHLADTLWPLLLSLSNISVHSHCPETFYPSCCLQVLLVRSVANVTDIYFAGSDLCLGFLGWLDDSSWIFSSHFMFKTNFLILCNLFSRPSACFSLNKSPCTQLIKLEIVPS